MLLSACQSPAQTPPPASFPRGVQTGPSMSHDPQILSTLLRLLEVKDKTRPSNEDFTQSSLKDILTVGTPAGFHLRNRYIRLGISLSDALVAAEDPRLKEQSIELARWERNEDIRSIALITLAGRKDPAHIAYFREALVNIQPEIRFAALEALEIWDLPAAKDEFTKVARHDLAPIVRIYAAQALARRGVPLGREVLLTELNSGDWIARAMAARYLGEHGEGKDYDTLLNRMTIEQNNDFVVAEIAIACLKLFPKRAPAPAAAVPTQKAPPPPMNGLAGSDLYVELAPLVITAPRFKIPANALIDGRINVNLLRLLDKASTRPTEEQLLDPSIKALNALSSPFGFQLKTRYTELGFLLIEGLAGSADLILRDRILAVARTGTNPQVRAAALVAAAYNRDPADRGLFQEALLSQNITVRFGAVEALQVWGRPEGFADIGNVARLDFSLPLRIYAAGVMQRLGDAGGRDILIRHYTDMDWLARAMAIRYLGEFGTGDDFERIMFNLPRETNNFVLAEMCGALLKLHPKRKK